MHKLANLQIHLSKPLAAAAAAAAMAKVSKTSAGRHRIPLRSIAGNVMPPTPASPPKKLVVAGAAKRKTWVMPMGFCFRPTNYELVHFYLVPKVLGESLPLEGVIHDLDVYRHDPEDLPIDSECPDWRWAHFFFFRAPEETSRCTPNGIWRPTRTPEEVVKDFNGEIIGFMRSFVFYRAEHSIARRTCWKMDEFRLNHSLDRLRNHEDPKMNHIVACEVYASKEDLKTEENALMEFSDETDPFAQVIKKSRTESGKEQEGEGEDEEEQEGEGEGEEEEQEGEGQEEQDDGGNCFNSLQN